jgi:hypothetical protein
VCLTKPLGDIGIVDYHVGVHYTNWTTAKSDFTLGYLELPSPGHQQRTSICTLTFDEAGNLKTIRWANEKLPN